MDGLERALEELAEGHRRIEEESRWLVNWELGEGRRREEERYERETLRRALALFNGGQGEATDQPWVQQRLMEQVGVACGLGLA